MVIGQSDEMLMRMVQEGDIDKSALLFERYYVKIYNYFLRNIFNRDLSMDLAQNTFFRMMNYRSAYKSNLPFNSWLFGIARNLLIDHVKAKYKNVESIDKVKPEQYSDNEVDVFENEALYYALGCLASEDRELIVLSRFQDLKYQEIAEILNLSVSAVKVRIHRAIKKLRTFYFEENLNTSIGMHQN